MVKDTHRQMAQMIHVAVWTPLILRSNVLPPPPVYVPPTEFGEHSR